MKEINYYVIGGQYMDINYGGTETLLGAKRLATKCTEYWDNFQGWHKPRVFKAEDCVLGKSYFGTNLYPKANAVPVASWSEYKKKWEHDCY